MVGEAARSSTRQTMIPGISYNQLLNDCLLLRQQLKNWMTTDPESFTMTDLFNLVTSTSDVLDQTKIYDEITSEVDNAKQS